MSVMGGTASRCWWLRGGTRRVVALLAGALLVLEGGAVRGEVREQPTAGPPVAATEQAGVLPEPQAVIARHVEAIGGMEAHLALRSRRATGTMELPEHGLRGIFSLSSAAPDRRVVELMIPEIGAFRQGYDGSVAWSIDPMAGARVLEGRELEERVEDADFYADVNLHRPGTTIQTVGRAAFQGRPCVKLRMAEHEAPESFLFFEEESGLLVGRVYQTTFEGASELVEVALDRYEWVGAVRVSMRMRIASARGVHLIELAEVEFDVVSGEVFELPPEIRGIVEERRASGNGRVHGLGGEGAGPQ